MDRAQRIRGPDLRRGGPGTRRRTAPFRVVEVLGHGGMGEVVLAEQSWLDREVAVKVARREVGIVALAAEARIAAAIDHPGVPPIHDAGRDFIIMKRIRGGDLSEALRQGLPVAAAVACIADAAAAAAWAHDQGLVHRDIKPANLMRDADGSTYLVDWGLAVAVGPAAGAAARGAPRLVPENACAGTPSYLAPEQALGDVGRIGPATDVFLLGATLFRVLAGVPPWPGRSGEALARCASGDVPPPPADCPPGLAAPLRRSMDPDPSRRGTAMELRRDLLAWLSGRAAEDEARALLALPASGPDAGDPYAGVRVRGERAERAAGLAGHLPEVRSAVSAARDAWVDACLAQHDLGMAAAWAAGAGDGAVDRVAAARRARAAALRRQGWWRVFAWAGGAVAAGGGLLIALHLLGAPGRELAARRSSAGALVTAAAVAELPPAGDPGVPAALARAAALLARADGLSPGDPAVADATRTLAAAAVADALARGQPADAEPWLAEVAPATRALVAEAAGARARELDRRRARLAELRALAAWSQPWRYADPSRNPDTPEGRRYQDPRWGLRVDEAAVELAAWDGPELGPWLRPLLDGPLVAETRLACAVLARRPDLDDGGALARLAEHPDPARSDPARRAWHARGGGR